MADEANDKKQAESQVQATPPKKKKSKAKYIIIGIVAFIVLGSIGAAMGDTPSDNGQQSNQAATEQVSSDTAEAAPKKVEEKPSVPAEYTSALYKADTYANGMNMSKQGVYEQLTSEYGEQFSAKAAKYAIDNVKADWNANALAKAKTYQNDMHMSPAAIHDQLTSDYGEKFTVAQADFAIEHLTD